MRCFITGIGGFAGTHLADQLLAAGHDVAGSVTAHPERRSLQELRARYPRLGALAVADVTDRGALERALAASAPDAVFHLAGVAYVPRADADAGRTVAVNTVGTINLLEAVDRVAPRSRVLVVGSSEAYGAASPEALPIREDTPLRPVSIYGLSKAAADMAAFQKSWSSDLAVIRVRPFNHTGPGQSSSFVCSDFARQIARIEIGAAPPVLRVGNLDSLRDFSDVRDVVRGYALLCEAGSVGEVYNLCSGIATRVGDILAMLIDASTVQVEVIEEHDRVRHREIVAVVGSAERARALGWRPEIPLERTLRDLLAFWRRHVVAQEPS